MSPLPSALLSRFYERESLRNTATGFELRFKNLLAPSTIVGVGPLTLDGRVYQGEQLILSFERPAKSHRPPPEPMVRTAKYFEPEKAREQRSIPFEINTVLRISVNGAQLQPGPYHLEFSLRTKEVGDLLVTAEDIVSAA
jgi:hypothetical protein